MVGVEEVVAVPYFDCAVFDVDEFACDGLRALLHLVDLGLHGAVGPDGAVGACSDAVAVILFAQLLLFEVEVEQRVTRRGRTALHSLVADGYVVHQGIADVDVGLLSVRFLVASDVHREGGIDDVACGFGFSLHAAVDAEAHLRAVVEGNHTVPVLLPVSGKSCGEGVFVRLGCQACQHVVVVGMIGIDVRYCRGRCLVGVEVEDDRILALLLHAELPAALGHKRAAGTYEFAWEHVEGDGQGLSFDVEILRAIDFHPLVMPVQVDDVVLPEHLLLDRSGLHAWNNEFRTSHDVGRSVLWRKVGERASGLGKACRNEVPEGTAHRAVVAVDGVPHLVEEAAAIAGYRDVFVHERGANVTILVLADLHFKGHRGGVARADDVLGRMAVGVAAVHPVACRVVFASLLDHFADVRTFAALVACTPEEHGRLVAVAQHHAAHTFLVHRYPSGIGADVFGGMCLVARLVDDVEAVACGILQVAGHGRIVRGADGIEAELLQDGHVLLDKFIFDAMSAHRVLHVRTFGIDLQFLAIEVEDVVDDFRLLEAKVLACAVDDVALGIAELHLEGVEVGRLGSPLQRVDEVLRQRELHLVGLSVVGGGLALHRGHLLALGIQHLRFHDEVALLCCSLVASGGGRQFEVGIAVVAVEVGGDVPVHQACLRRGIDIDIVEDACQAPVVLSFEVEAVAVFDHEHRKLVAPLLDVGGDVVLGRLLGSLVVAHLVSVHPKERC